MNITKYVAGQFGKPTGIGGIISTFIMNRMNQIQYKSVMSNLNCCKSDRVLDIGFGNGYHLNLLAKKNEGDFYSIEISDDMLKAGCKRNRKLIKRRKIHLAVGNVMDIPFENYFFDKIYTVNTVYFWKDLDKSLSEIRRVLKSNGIFLYYFENNLMKILLHIVLIIRKNIRNRNDLFFIFNELREIGLSRNSY